MKTMVFLICFGSALAALAADTPAQFNATVKPTPLTTPSERYQNFLVPRPDAPVIAIGKSDFVVGGPLAEGFRPLPHVDNLSRGQKFLRLPLIRLLVPKPMPMPPEGGKYFAWKNEHCSLSWPEAANRPPIAKGPE